MTIFCSSIRKARTIFSRTALWLKTPEKNATFSTCAQRGSEYQTSPVFKWLLFRVALYFFRTKVSPFGNLVTKTATSQKGLETCSLMSTFCHITLLISSPSNRLLLLKSNKVSLKVYCNLCNSLTFMFSTGKDTFSTHYQPTPLTQSQESAYFQKQTGKSMDC